MFLLRHDAPKDPGAVLTERVFPFATLAEAVAQGKHDLSRPGSAPLVVGVFDENGKRLLTPRQIASTA